MERFYDVHIEPCLKGFVIRVGCETATAETPKEVAELVTAYFEDPRGIEKRLRATSYGIRHRLKATEESYYNAGQLEKSPTAREEG